MEDFLNKIGPDFFIKEIAERLDSERLRQIADLLIQSEKTKRQLKKLAWNKDILYYVVRLNDDLEIVENFMPFSSKDKAIDDYLHLKAKYLQGFSAAFPTTCRVLLSAKNKSPLLPV